MHVPLKIVAVARNNRVLWSATNPSRDELFDRTDAYLRRQGFEWETRLARRKAAKKGGFHVHHGEGSVEVSV